MQPVKCCQKTYGNYPKNWVALEQCLGSCFYSSPILYCNLIPQTLIEKLVPWTFSYKRPFYKNKSGIIRFVNFQRHNSNTCACSNLLTFTHKKWHLPRTPFVKSLSPGERQNTRSWWNLFIRFSMTLTRVSGTLSSAVHASFMRGIVKGRMPSVCYQHKELNVNKKT